VFVCVCRWAILFSSRSSVVVSVVVLCCVLRKLMCDLRWCVYSM
jgi:hypothetical protein